MNILITGATGFIGSHLTKALSNTGHQLVLVGRDIGSLQSLWPNCKTIQLDYVKAIEPSHWISALKDIDIVINAVGIINETRTQTFKNLHKLAPIALFKAAEMSNVKKVIQISALGADDSAFSQYHLSKQSADNALSKLKLDWAVLRPSIVYGPGAKSMALFSAMAALPLVPLINKGEQPVQPIHVDDLVSTVLNIIERKTPTRKRIDLAGPEPLTMRQLLEKLRFWLGLNKMHSFSMPYTFALQMAKLGGLLGSGPVNKESIEMLQRGNTGDVNIFVKEFQFKPRAIDSVLSHHPSQQSDRWFAGLLFMPLLLRLTLAFIWISTGFISAFIYPVTESLMMFSKVGLTGELAKVVLYGAVVLNILLGLLTFSKRYIKPVLLLQTIIILVYSLIITCCLTEYLWHPFGPVTKNLPILLLIAMLWIMERRPQWTI